MASAAPPQPEGGRSAASVDALYAMMKRKQADNSGSQSKKAKRRDDGTSTAAAHNPSKKRKPSLLTADTAKQSDSSKKKSGTPSSSASTSAGSISSSCLSSGSRVSPSDKDKFSKAPVTAASLVAQRTIRPSTASLAGPGSDLPASSLAAQLVLSSQLSAASSSPPPSSSFAFSPRAFSRPRWSHEPISRRNVSGNLVVWPLWVAAHSKAQQLVSQGPSVRSKAASGGKARAQSRRDDAVYSSDDGDDDSLPSDAEADLPDDDTPAHPIRTSTFHLPPVSVPQSLLLAMRPDRRDAEIEKLELKLLSKKAVIERDTRRLYVDVEGGSRHMVMDDPLDKPATIRQSSTGSFSGLGTTNPSATSTSARSNSPSPYPHPAAPTAGSPAATHTPASTGIPIPFTKHHSTFICGVCSKSFPDLSKLRRHANVHVDGDRRRLDERGGVREAAYVCLWPECGKSFLHLNSLRFHERSHKHTTQPQPPQHPQQPQQLQQAMKQQRQGKEEKEEKGASRSVKAEAGVKVEVKRESSG